MMVEIVAGLSFLAAGVMLPVAVSRGVIAVTKRVLKQETGTASQEKEWRKTGAGKTSQKKERQEVEMEGKPWDAGGTDVDFRMEKAAALSKMGDIVAMEELAYFFRNHCSEPLRRLLEAYEQQPDQERADAVEEFMKRAGKEGMMAQAYMMWLVRAALYGNEKAGELVDRCPYYKEKSYMPYKLLAGGEEEVIKFWDSDSLWEIGLLDMERGCTDCSFRYVRKSGCFVLTYVADYEPPDEDGFGAEWEYGHIYFDEFFCRIPVGKEEDIPEQMRILEKEREAFWNAPLHDAPNRKYRRRVSGTAT